MFEVKLAGTGYWEHCHSYEHPGFFIHKDGSVTCIPPDKGHYDYDEKRDLNHICARVHPGAKSIYVYDPNLGSLRPWKQAIQKWANDCLAQWPEFKEVSTAIGTDTTKFINLATGQW